MKFEFMTGVVRKWGIIGENNMLKTGKEWFIYFVCVIVDEVID